MATKECLFLIYKIEDFADTHLGKVTKFQGNIRLAPFWSSEPFTGLEMENTRLPGAYRVKNMFPVSRKHFSLSFDSFAVH